MKVFEVTIKTVLVLEDDAINPEQGDFLSLLELVRENEDRSEVSASEWKQVSLSSADKLGAVRKAFRDMRIQTFEE